MKNIKTGFRLIIILLLCFTVSVSTNANTTDNTTNTKANLKYKKVILKKQTKKTLKVTKGTKIKLLPSYPKNLKNKKFTYKSSNKKVATVTKKGIVKTRRKGVAIITVKLNAKKTVKTNNTNKTNTTSQTNKSSNKLLKKYRATYKCKIIVKKNNSTDDTKSDINTDTNTNTNTNTDTSESTETKNPSISFSEGKKIYIDQYSTLKLHVIFTDMDATDITFKSMDESIATVDNKGLVKSIRCGEAYITATTEDDKYRTSIRIICENTTGFLTESSMAAFDGIDDCTNLMIVAHPDDETLWGGAHLKEGKWFILCLTNNYNSIRFAEYNSVLNAAGAKGAILDYPDIYYDTGGMWHISSWDYIKEGLNKDIEKIINYKKWDMIVTHSPTGETGHTHHLATNASVTNACKELNQFDNLWYFGTFYKPGNVPEDLPRISDEELEFKQNLVDIYKNEAFSIELKWKQMIPHENWVMAKDY